MVWDLLSIPPALCSFMCLLSSHLEQSRVPHPQHLAAAIGSPWNVFLLLLYLVRTTLSPKLRLMVTTSVMTSI